MSYWNYISNYINQVNHIYFAVGCGMQQYTFSDESKSNYEFDITEKNNQQYPCFLNNFNGKKMVILIDPELEFEQVKDNNLPKERDLVIQQYFDRIEQPLKIIMKTQNLRILENNEVIVIATKSKFYYEETIYMSKDDIINFRETIDNFNKMIDYCIHGRTKLIVQDYSGKDLTSIYIKYFDIYGSQILNNVMFDVSQNNGGCFIELKPSHAKVNSNNNFIQEKYLKLVDCVKSDIYKDMHNSRLSNLNYPLSWIIFNLQKDKKYSEYNFENYKELFIIYECKNDPNNKLESLQCLIKNILDDILKSRSINLSYTNTILSKINNRTEFNKEISLLKLL